MSPLAALATLTAAELERPVSPGAHALAAKARARHGGVRAVLFYGSCLRRNDDEGVLDFYVLVDRYENAYDRRLLMWLNRVLPPNVFYLEAEANGQTVRSKYAVVEFDAFVEAMTDASLETYFWGRFAQPAAIVGAIDDDSRQRLALATATAILTFLRNALPLAPARCTAAEIWRAGLSASYRSEVRAERPGAADVLLLADPERYERVTALAVQAWPEHVRPATHGTTPLYDVRVDEDERRHRLKLWRKRQWIGKGRFLLRILRNAYTVEGGVEYAMWKVSRHSGFVFDTHWRERPIPLLALLREIWRAWRAGAFR